MIHTAKQLKDKVKNMSGGNSEVAQALIRTYFMERFLERVSVSEYRNNFILKGGMLVASIVGVDMRATMDIDTTVKALAVWDNILIVSHFDLVKREGGSISIYNLETKELNNIELGHDVEQMTINENVIYILSDKIIYQYELKDMNLYLKCKTQIKKSNEENYLSGIFYIKPESMKFTL